MHRIDTSTAQKDKFGQGKNGFTDGDPSTGRQSTDLDADMFDALQEEVCAVIEAANITLKKGELSQLLTALKALFLAGDDSRVSGALQKDKNLSDVADTSKALENLGAYSKAEADSKYIPDTSIGVHNGQVMAVNSRYPSENNLSNAFMSNNTPTLSAAESTHKPALEISNNGNKSAAAVLMLHREGEFATYFGLDQDNALAIGGYSFDKVRHRIFHEGFTGNLSTQADAQSRADAAYNNAVNSASSQINNAFGSANAGYWNVGHNGLIFQSGRATVQGAWRITFPVAFPNAVTCIILTVGTSGNVNATYNNDNNAGFDVYVNGGSGTDSLSWFAMGD